MPTIKIELREGRDIESLLKLKKTVMDSVVEILQLPDNDRNIRLIEYKHEFFQMQSPYQILIEISMFKGRTSETKKKLYKTIVENLGSTEIKKDEVLIFLNEQPLENWGGRGGVSADEMSLGFKVDI